VTAALTISEVTKTFGSTVALDQVSCSFGPGIHALVGGNGSGKSTLVTIVAGVQRADAGTVAVHGHDIAVRGANARAASDAGVQVVHQSLGLVDSLTVSDNLLLGPAHPWWRRVARPDHHRDVAARLEMVGCAVRPDRPVGSLTVAERTLVAIARSLELDPQHGQALLLDEVTASLPAHEVARVFELLRDLGAMGHCIVMVTHRLGEVRQIAESALVLRDGRVAATLRRPIDLDHLAAVITGGGRIASAVDAPSDGEPVLVAEGLAAGRATSVSFAVTRGEIVGLAGLVGAGRTSTLEVIAGLRSPKRGHLAVGSVIRSVHTPADRLAAGVAHLPDTRSAAVFADLSVTDNVMLQSIVRRRALSFVRPRAQRRLAEQEITHGGVKCAGPDAAMRTLSGGNQQKLLVRRVLRTLPAVVAIDEPTHGVDVGARRVIHDALRGAAAQGLAVTYASSEEQELAEFGSRVVVVADGRTRTEITGPRTASQIMTAVNRAQAERP
jgi:ribose transport system ATP-binding protein